MSGETEADVSGWTVDSLKAHLEAMAREADLRYQQRFDAQTRALDAALLAQKEAVAAALAAAKEAVSKSEVASERRFEAVNEFRAQLADQTSSFIPRAEVEARAAATLEKIDALAAALATLTRELITRSEATALLAATEVRLTTIEQRATENATKIEQQRSRAAGLAAGWGYLVAVVGLVATALVIYGALHK